MNNYKVADILLELFEKPDEWDVDHVITLLAADPETAEIFCTLVHRLYERVDVRDRTIFDLKTRLEKQERTMHDEIVKQLRLSEDARRIKQVIQVQSDELHVALPIIRADMGVVFVGSGRG